MKTQSIQQFLKDIVDTKPNSIEAYVAGEALDYDDPQSFFNDLNCHGCISGMVSGLIYYCDTHRFFDDHYEEILELKEQFEDETGSTLKIEGDLKNYLAWFAFEEIAFRLNQKHNEILSN